MKLRSRNPKLTQKKANEKRNSEFTIKRHGNDLYADSLYNKKGLKKNTHGLSPISYSGKDGAEPHICFSEGVSTLRNEKKKFVNKKHLNKLNNKKMKTFCYIKI